MDSEMIIYIVGLIVCLICLAIVFIVMKNQEPKNAGQIQIFYDDEGQEHFNINFTLELEEIEELQSIVLDIIKTQNPQLLK